jgi:hypothetical protein
LTYDIIENNRLTRNLRKEKRHAPERRAGPGRAKGIFDRGSAPSAPAEAPPQETAASVPAAAEATDAGKSSKKKKTSTRKKVLL